MSNAKSASNGLGRDILLINPYIYDIRYPWIRWNQPTGLLRISSLLGEYGNDRALLDCLQPDMYGRVRRHRIRQIRRGEYILNLWNYGMQKYQFQSFLKQMKKKPQEIWITCMVGYWWKSVHEIFKMCKNIFPKTNVVLGGSYPTLFTEHAKDEFGILKVCRGENISDKLESGFHEDTIMTGCIPDVFNKQPDFGLYERTPSFASVNVIKSGKSVFRNVESAALEIECLLNEFKIRNFAFYDDNLLFNKGEYFRRVLGALIKRNVNARFWGLHGIDPHEITENTVSRMKEVGFQMISLQCVFEKDRSLDLDCYREAVRMITGQGYRKRSSAISCQYYIGKPRENLEQVIEDILELHHIVGTVIPVPFLPTPGMKEFQYCSKLMKENNMKLEDLNVNLFPFAEFNGCTVSDYFAIIRMTATLNKKLRRTTFDYLGDNEVAQALRRSISFFDERTDTRRARE
jgi:hypothetical protein